MPRTGRKENLKPIKTVEEAREKGRMGGIKSGIAKREKRLLSEIYREYLNSKYGGDIKGHVNKVLKRGDAATVAMLREMCERTEGTNININIEADIDSMRKKLVDAIVKINGITPGTTDPTGN